MFMQAMNYQLILNKTLSQIQADQQTPTLLLHVCCAPCSSYVLEYLSSIFSITVYFYNPNIYPEEEYILRLKELKKFITEYQGKNPIRMEEAAYLPAEFYTAVQGLENEKEGGGRCKKCYALRLEAVAKIAAELSFDYFTTTLSVSPLKNASFINELGEDLGKKYGISFLYADFKKKEGYKRSIELSKQYGMYRQNYCGCEFSMNKKDKI